MVPKPCRQPAPLYPAPKPGAPPAGRLKGINIGVNAVPSLPLTVEGHVHRLIEEAVDKERLGGMYIWWMPWF